MFLLLECIRIHAENLLGRGGRRNVLHCSSKDSHRSRKSVSPERKIAHREGAITVKDEPISKVSVTCSDCAYIVTVS